MTVLVGRKAPDFTAAAVLSDNTIVDKFTLSEATAGKYGLIFFYPLDFTFVCPTELISVHNRMEQFNSRKVEVIAISIDSQYSHFAWRNTEIRAGGIGQVGFTLVADVSHKICQDYGVEHPVASVALRGAFIIDRQGVVRAQIVNDLPLGRSIDEILRLVDALQFYEKNGEVCPANWRPGATAMKPTNTGVAKFLESNSKHL